MNLLGVGSEVVKIIDLLQTGVAGNNHDAISEFLHDAKRFILRNRQIADVAPLQLYCSGLIFAPQMSIIRQELETEIPGWVQLLPRVAETWSLELQSLEGPSKWVTSVAFSPDGQLLASGSGTPRQVPSSRLLKAIQTRFSRWPSHPTANYWHPVLRTKQSGSGTP
ncbi:hypothetical protein AAEP93_003261 [Penicillium crustosum]